MILLLWLKTSMSANDKMVAVNTTTSIAREAVNANVEQVFDHHCITGESAGVHVSRLR